ncbi:hypothetical protein DPMN_118079 [Dreissena polymorpha]|uniref:C-type lectin domain-containing protein n=1 Tax=Dreissena polymorpha TaxID=45954 RepID=A0A9D4JLC1_DREPO|nr:hypothetical protein DPMN_118079 [Dreissena polymorpha]
MVLYKIKKVSIKANLVYWYTKNNTQNIPIQSRPSITCKSLNLFNQKALPKCPAGARKLITGNDTSCYTFHITALSWYEAVKVCKSEAPNGHLVSVNSRKEQEFLVDTIQTDSGNNLEFIVNYTYFIFIEL